MTIVRGLQAAAPRGWRRQAIVLLSVLLLGACSSSKPSDLDGKQMERGLNLLYKSGDPAGAVWAFREVLARNPSHYGAHYQLAVALDQSGKPAEARPAWEEVRRLAEAAKAPSTLATARTRLAARDTVSEAVIQATMMNAGIYLLPIDPAAAAEQFRAVLRRNPLHYGATYQLAIALDRIGRQAEARVVWKKVLEMATTYQDATTIQTARARLK